MKTVNPSLSLRVDRGRKRTIKFYTLGCKVNQYDTQSLRERFEKAGFKEGQDARRADVCVVNTCTVTHRADADSLNIIRRARRLNPKAEIIVTGCLAKRDKSKIREAARGLTFLKDSSLPRPGGISYFKGHARAFLKIQDGCDNLCSYCKVPLVRGASRSRPLEDIVREAKRLTAGGHKEIVLCGICLGAYGKDLKARGGLTEVIEALEKVEGLSFIRLSSIELNDVTPSLISLLCRSRKFCPHLHIPLQSGDDGILKKMNRKYTSDDFLKKVGSIKKEVSGIAITTDVLVGFPTETEEQFKNTLKVIRGVSPSRVHVFPYSRREGTRADAVWGVGVETGLVKKRIAQIRALAQECSLVYRMGFLGSTADVLIERRWKQGQDLWIGRSANYMEVLVRSPLNIENRLIRIKLKKGPAPYFLAGDFC